MGRSSGSKKWHACSVVTSWTSTWNRSYNISQSINNRTSLICSIKGFISIQAWRSDLGGGQKCWDAVAAPEGHSPVMTPPPPPSQLFALISTTKLVAPTHFAVFDNSSATNHGNVAMLICWALDRKFYLGGGVWHIHAPWGLEMPPAQFNTAEYLSLSYFLTSESCHWQQPQPRATTASTAYSE